MALSELRQTLRRLVRQPGFTAAPILSLSPGIGATVAAVAGALLLAGLTANYLPARRASRTDPLQALRFE